MILIVVIAKDMCCKPRIVYAIDLRCGFAENESDLRSENVRPEQEHRGQGSGSTGDLVYSPEVARIESPREGLILIVVIAKDMCCKPRIVYAIDLRCSFAENENNLRSENVRPLIS